MHPVSIPEGLRAEIAERRDRVWAHRSYDPERLALLVVDMQNHFVAPEGLSSAATATGIIPNINRLAEGVRRAGGSVVWVRSTFTAEGRSAWDMFFGNFIAPGRRDEFRRGLMSGTWGHELHAELDLDHADPIVTKDRFSPFVAGSSDLDARLRSAGVDTVLVAGTKTNVCCDSTARDAMMLDYRSVMIDDANAAGSDDAHVAALSTFAAVFGDVMSTDEALARL